MWQTTTAKLQLRSTNKDFGVHSFDLSAYNLGGYSVRGDGLALQILNFGVHSLNV